MLLTACEKGLVDGIADVAPTGQAAKSVLQVRTRSGGSAGEEATVAYPIAVYVFAGEECKAVQTIGDEGQTLNIPLVEGTYTVYAIGGASSSDYVLPTADDALATSAELTLLSPNEKSYSGNTGMTVSTLETVAAAQGTDAVSGWRPMTYSEALLLQAAHTDLGIDGSRKYLFDDNGTVRQMQMSNGSVSIPSSTAAYVRPVATVTISKE